MKSSLTLSCLVLGATLLMPAPGYAQTTIATLAELAKSPPGIKISYGNDPLQFGELTLPEGAGPHPVVVFLHGGCWLAKYDLPHTRALAGALSKEGFAVWNIEYRRVGDAGGGWPGTFLDVGSGADHLQTLAAEHKLDLDHVIASGHSAGGHLALWLAGRHKLPASSALHAENPLHVSAVLALAPASQLDELHKRGVCGNVVDKLLGGSPKVFPERYDHAMPSRLAPLGVPQVLLLGKLDTDWSWNGEAYLKDPKLAEDKTAEAIIAPDAGHFELIDPNTTTWVLVRDAMHKLNERKPERAETPKKPGQTESDPLDQF